MTLSPSFFRKYASFIILFVLIVTISGIIWFVILPLKQSLLDRARGIQEVYAEDENHAKQISQLPELKNQYTIIEEKESTLDILLMEGQIVDFIKTLEGIAVEMNVQMIITSKENGQITVPKKVSTKIVVAPTSENADTPPDASTTKGKVVNIVDDVPYDRYLRLNIKGEGTYSNIVSFLKKIETLPVGLDVVGMEMKKIDGTKTNVSASTTGSSPFSFLGSGDTAPQTSPQVVVPDLLEATLDMLVYVNK